MLIPPFALAGYRSFGSNSQRFEKLSKINLLIGSNNCGKSNVLRFIHNIYPKLEAREPIKLSAIERHLPNHAAFRFGLKISLELNAQKDAYEDFNKFVLSKMSGNHPVNASHALRVFQRKAEIENTKDAWFYFGQDKILYQDNWTEAFNVLNDRELYALWQVLTGRSNGGRIQHWIPETLKVLTPSWEGASVEMIPAIRRIGIKGSLSDEFSGDGLIERLAKIQNPDVHSQTDKLLFEKINKFLKSVTDNDSAMIEIPHERDTIIVHMDGKALPLESLGTGIQEVIILAAASTILQNTVICMEEPELHLNPILQRKLIRYLESATNNQYFVTTHSAALMDTPGAEIYHVQLDDGQSAVERVTSDRKRSSVCENLGYHPSDLLQANCIIWVEGPSDRLYLNSWIHKRAPELIEGIQFSIMFYGGRLASHLTGRDLDEEVTSFISLRRLNRRATILIDSDRSSSRAILNSTKERLVAEFDLGPGCAWVTDGREIENYLRPDQVTAAINAVLPTAIPGARLGRYDKVLDISGPLKAKHAPKVDIAKYITANYGPDDARFDLGLRLDALVAFIRASNP
jgi:hypothetical protein